MNIVGGITFLSGVSLVIFFTLYDDWADRLGILVTVILGFLFCLI